MAAVVFNFGDYLYRSLDCPLEQLPDPQADVHEAAVHNLEAARLRRELRRLPDLERRVLEWHWGLDGPPLSHRQIARRLSISVGSAWNIEQRALSQLRDRYDIADAA